MDIISVYEKLKEERYMPSYTLNEKQLEFISHSEGEFIFGGRQSGETTATAVRALKECVNKKNNVIIIASTINEVLQVSRLIESEIRDSSLECLEFCKHSSEVIINIMNRTIRISLPREALLRGVRADIAIVSSQASIKINSEMLRIINSICLMSGNRPIIINPPSNNNENTEGSWRNWQF